MDVFTVDLNTVLIKPLRTNYIDWEFVKFPVFNGQHREKRLSDKLYSVLPEMYKQCLFLYVK